MYNAGQGLKLQNNTFSIESDQQEDSIKFLQIGTNTIGLKGITTAVNKALSDAKDYTDIQLQDYYIKSQVNTIAKGLSDSIAAIKQNLNSNYYTSNHIDQKTGALSNSLAALKQDLHENYYTSAKID